MKDIKAIEQEADEYADKVAFVVPYDGSNNFYNDEVYKEAKKHFIAGRSKSLEEKEKEIERLKGLIETAYVKGWRNSVLSSPLTDHLQQFKTENNL